jgi:hypothetical protein
MFQELTVILVDLSIKAQLFAMHLIFILFLEQNSDRFQVVNFALGKFEWKLNDEVPLRLGCELFELTFDIHLVVTWVLYAKLKQRPHANSELPEVSEYLLGEMPLGQENFNFFLPLACGESIKTEVDFFGEDIVLNFLII